MNEEVICPLCKESIGSEGIFFKDGSHDAAVLCKCGCVFPHRIEVKHEDHFCKDGHCSCWDDGTSCCNCDA
jgi:hypothetical protein